MVHTVYVELDGGASNASYRSLWRATAVGTGLVCALLMVIPIVHAKYDDTVHLKNGDRLKGDVKELAQNLLKFKTDAMGTVYIRWDKIASLESTKLLRIELDSGRRVVGSVRASDETERLTIARGRNLEVHERDALVAFVPLKLQNAWLDRIEGGAKFGLSGTKGSNTLQWNLGADITYRGENFELGSRWDSIVTDKSDDTSSQRISFFNSYRRLLADRWFWTALAAYEKNDELGISDRWSVGAGAGRFVFRTNSIELLLQGGVFASREFRTDQTETHLESYVGGSIFWFQHGFPKTDIRTEVLILPSLTESGRVRSNVDLSIKREFIEDLFLDLSLYYSSDSKAPDEASGDDWGIVTSVEYRF